MHNDGIFGLIDAYLDGGIDDASLEQLRAWLRSDKANLRTFARRMMIHQQLREAMLVENSVASLQAIRSQNVDGLQAECPPKPIVFPDDVDSPAGGLWVRFRSVWFVVAIVTVVLGIGVYLADQYSSRALRANFAAADAKQAPGFRAVDAATLVNVTNCRWDSRGEIVDLPANGAIRPGQVLRLVEGIAEISSTRPSGGSAKFVLEGPLAMVMTGDGTPTLQHGKLFMAIDPADDVFLLDTPLGLVKVDSGTSMGIVASGEDVTIHVFAGSAMFELLWASDAMEDDQFKIAAGTSLRLIGGKDNTVSVQRGSSNERNFIASVPMAEDRLAIGEEYIAAIRKAGPLGYWRFESDAGQFVRNEVSERFHFRIRNEVGWRDYPGNRAIELGGAGKSGYLLTDDDFDDLLKKAYSVEAWVKPSHIHSGSIFGLLDWAVDAPVVARHGILLDLCGPPGKSLRDAHNPDAPKRSPVNPVFHPTKARFLHRVPMSSDANQGNSCYSKKTYECRKWQHFVGVKDCTSLKLYINGELVAEETVENDGPSGVRALIGQAWPSGIVGKKLMRQYVGEIDELALYDRALDRQELVEHFRLGREASSAQTISN